MITTPIFYANAAPHIGHLYTLLLADSIAVWKRFAGYNVKLMTGTDEHGIKIQKKADAEKLTPIELGDRNSQKFRELAQISQVRYDDFIRTTEQRHQDKVKDTWLKLKQNNGIAIGSHEGYYSINDEGFYMKKDLIEKNNCAGEPKYYTELGEKVDWVTEENYLFKFEDSIKQTVKSWLESDPSPVKPVYVKESLLKDLESLKDSISISRPKKRISWGIEVPDDKDQTIYVWLDALINYKTVLDGFNNFDGEMLHVIGKDISKFHCIYWPAFLNAGGYPLPKEVVVHGHWKKDNMKMSKSIGNVVDPIELIQKYGVSATRAYLISSGPMIKDSNFEESNLIHLHDSIIVDGFVNMFYRGTGK